MRYLPNPVKLPRRGQRGITGLETAIVLIAFVVVSSVFALAALSTGLFSADKSKETINAGLTEARGTLEVRGSIIAKSTGGAIDQISFQVSNAAGGATINLTPGATLITYLDASQMVTLGSGDFTAMPIGGADSDKLVEPGEMYETKITGLVAKLTADLTADTAFAIEVKPPQGAVIHLSRGTPVTLETYNDLQ